MRFATASAEVGKVNRAVDEIAFQINLLALNAAVEAAVPAKPAVASRWSRKKFAASRNVRRKRRKKHRR